MATSKKINKRVASTKKYIDALQEKHSKLCVVRVDLGYKKDDNNEVNVTLEDANKDIDRMFNNMRSKPSIFKDKVGYVCKREYTEDKGVHMHAFFLYDGQKVLKDKYKADEIGMYWQQLTDNKGSYHNCNRNHYKKRGIGMLDYKDSDKRKNLDTALSYLCKEEQSIESITDNKKDRAFTRGTIPKSDKSNMGRPRKEK